MEKLAGWKVVIAGSAGLLGLGLVRAFRMAGATVIVPVRDSAELAELRAHCDDLVCGDLIVEEADLGDPDSAANFSEWLGRNFAGLDVAVVAPATGLAHGAFGYFDSKTWAAVVREGLAGHLHAMRALIPWLNESRGVVATIGSEAPSGLVSVLEQIGTRSIAVVDVILEKLTVRKAERYNPQDIGPWLVDLVDAASPSAPASHRLAVTVKD